MDKRGISPLIATVLLIAFSVALGAVVMSWGETYIEEHLNVGEGQTEVFAGGCDLVDLKVLDIAGERQECLGPDSVEVFLSNGPSVDIISVKGQVIGSDVLNVENVLLDPLSRDTLTKVTVPYKSLASAEGKDLGLVKQVILIPYIVQQGQPLSCANKAVALSQLKGC